MKYIFVRYLNYNINKNIKLFELIKLFIGLKNKNKFIRIE